MTDGTRRNKNTKKNEKIYEEESKDEGFTVGSSNSPEGPVWKISPFCIPEKYFVISLCILFECMV